MLEPKRETFPIIKAISFDTRKETISYLRNKKASCEPIKVFNVLLDPPFFFSPFFTKFSFAEFKINLKTERK